jgi:hypothetical protein
MTPERRAIQVRAVKAAAEKVRREGQTGRGDRLWDDDDDVLRRIFPDFDALERLMPYRSLAAIKARARKIGLYQKDEYKIWKCTDVHKLRSAYQRGGLREALAAFPECQDWQIRGRVAYYGIRHTRPLKPQGIPLIDALRQRARDLGLSMEDLDHLAGGGFYFRSSGWTQGISGKVTERKILRVMRALGGRLEASWTD